jgi:HSP20 family molecular chaperone IbpA
LEKVTAKLEKGILHIAAPQATQAKPAAGAAKQTNVAAA